MSKPWGDKMNTYATVDDFFTSNMPLIVTFNRLSVECMGFSDDRKTLVALMDNKVRLTTGITADKSSSFAETGNLIFKSANKALVWAQDNNNQELAVIFTVVPSLYAQKSYAKKLEQAKAVYAALAANAAELTKYNITDAEIAAIATSIKICEAAIIAPGKATKSKQVAGISAKVLADKLDKRMKTIDTMIVGEFSDSAPAFLTGYRLACKTDSKGIRHTGISATITDAATRKAIENAVLTIDSLGKTVTSNMAGLAEIIKMKSGSYHVSISAASYTTQLMDVTVGKGKVIDLAVSLVAS